MKTLCYISLLLFGLNAIVAWLDENRRTVDKFMLSGAWGWAALWVVIRLMQPFK